MKSEFPKVIELALQQGIWAILYIYLLFKMLKDNAAREEKYQSIIDRLSEKSNTILKTFRIAWMN